MIFRHLLSIAALPFVVTVVVPTWLARRDGIALAIGATTTQVMAQAAGIVLLSVGLLLFASSLRRFNAEGEGTLAPWDPPRRLVLHGPYRYVRNPMISGVIFILFGEALLVLSRPHLIWAVVFLAMNFVSIPLFEEPTAERSVRRGVRRVLSARSRFIPRLRPWHPNS
jgi:protein-S-isoprenylcysteine O-methyltransferase Ste14